MTVAVAPAEDADFPRLFEIASLAFNGNEPFWDACWPAHDTAAGRRTGAERWLQTSRADPNTTYLKAYDPATGEILGTAKWNIYNDTFPPALTVDPAHHGGDERETGYLTQLADTFLTERNAAVARTAGRLVSLDILAVDPAHQRKGVGVALVKWGTDRADALGFETVVESSVFGKGLYEKSGFVFVKDVKLVWPEPVQDRRMHGFAWLVRPKTLAAPAT